MVYVFLADGFEEIEALATVDIIRRAGIECTTVGVGNAVITGAHNIKVTADSTTLKYGDVDAVILPGGMPGTANLEQSDIVISAVKYAADNNKLIAAICAAPSILGHLGLLEGKTATCYDGFEKDLIGARVSGDKVCVDGNIITARGAGVAIDFALEIVAFLKNRKTAEKIDKAIKRV